MGSPTNKVSTKGGSDLVWYSIDREIFKTEPIFCRKNSIKKSKQVLKELLQKNWGRLILLLILLKLSLSPSNICLKNIFQLNWNSWFKSYIKHGNKLIISIQVLIVSRDRGKPIRDQTGLICFFYKKMDSVLKISLSIDYHTKSDPPLVPLPPYQIPCLWKSVVK